MRMGINESSTSEKIWYLEKGDQSIKNFLMNRLKYKMRTILKRIFVLNTVNIIASSKV